MATTGPVPADARERDHYLREHVEEIYLELTDGLASPLRLEELVFAAAEAYPGLTPTREEIDAELDRRLADKLGAEAAQGQFAAHVLASPAIGDHLVHAMLRPTAEALERLDDFRATGVADLGWVQVERTGRAGTLELRNPRALNAEDDADPRGRPRSAST